MKKFIMFLFPLIILTEACSSRALYEAVVSNNTNYIKSFRGNIDQPLDKDGTSALIYAAYYGKLEAIKALLEAHADANQTNKGGHTALMYAAFGGQTDVVNELIRAGADVNAVDKSGMTALSEAVMKKHKDIAAILIRAGEKK